MSRDQWMSPMFWCLENLPMMPRCPWAPRRGLEGALRVSPKSLTDTGFTSGHLQKRTLRLFSSDVSTRPSPVSGVPWMIYISSTSTRPTTRQNHRFFSAVGHRKLIFQVIGPNVTEVLPGFQQQIQVVHYDQTQTD